MNIAEKDVCAIGLAIFLCSLCVGLAYGGWSPPQADLYRPPSALPSPRTAGQWEPVNDRIPPQGGVVSVGLAPADPEVIYLALDRPGELYRSADGGSHWAEAAVGLADIAILSLAVQPENPDVVYAGTVCGVYRTNDGSHWQKIPNTPVSFVYGVAFVGNAGHLVIAGEEGPFWTPDGGETWHAGDCQGCTGLALAVGRDDTIYMGTVHRGVMTSSDGGRTWRSHGGVLAGETVPALGVTDRGAVYASTGHGLFHCPAESDEWRQVVLPDDWRPFSFAVHPQQPGPIYVGSRGKGLLVSGDSGKSWSRVADELLFAETTVLAAHPSERDVAYVGTRFHGLYKTVNGGETWRAASPETGRRAVMILAPHPIDPATMYAGALDGVYRSVDAGQSWQLLTAAEGKLIVQGLALRHDDPDHIFAATQAGVYRSLDAGRSWRRATADLGGINAFNVVVSPQDPGLIYAGSWGNNVLVSRDGGNSWASIHNGLETLSVHAFAIAPRQPDVLYAGTVEEIYRSGDGGSSWEALAQGIRPDITTFALVIDPQEGNRIYAGTTAGVYRSDDGGARWRWMSDGLGEVTVNALALDPSDPKVIYAGTEHHGLYRSDDAGHTWNLQELKGLSVFSIVHDAAGITWLATGRGVFKEAAGGHS